MKKRVSIIIPCYQESSNIADLKIALDQLYASINATFDMEVVTVDDGSSDKTFELLVDLKEKVSYPLKVVKLSGNFGPYNALMAGLKHANGDCFIQLHADLQDSPEYIPSLIEHWRKGNKLVIGQRVKREEGFLYLLGANLYHTIVGKIALPNAPKGGYDLILFDKQLKDEISNIEENNISIPYLVSSLKFPYALVPITRTTRKNGKSNYNFFKRVSLLINSVVSFSRFPIQAITFFALINLIGWLVISILKFASVISLSLINLGFYTVLTFILVALSIIAEYLWQTIEVSRNRPNYVIDEIVE